MIFITSETKLCYNVTETAQALGVSRPTVYQLMRTADFPVLEIGARKLIPVAKLEQWIDEHSGGGEQWTV